MKTYEATEIAYKNGYQKGLEDGKPKWIPVTERLPDKDGTYLVRWADKSVSDADYESIQGGFGYWLDIAWDVADWFSYVDITHWMPLPQAPKGE